MSDISQWIARWAAFVPDKSAIRFEGRDIPYADFDNAIADASGMLRDGLGVGRGDRVAFLGFNSPEFLALLFACARLGAIMVPLNWRLAPPELRYILDHAAAAALFAEPEFRGAAADTGFAGARVGMGFAGDGWRDYSDLAGDSRAVHAGAGGSDDTVLIVYTSGTTGRPKGAMLSQNAMLFNAVNAAAAHDFTSADLVLTNLPMFHVGGLNIQTIPAFHAGATVILQRRFDVDRAVQALREERPTTTILVPALMAAVRDHPEWPVIDFSCLRCLVTGSTNVPPSILSEYLARGVPVVQVYGATETAPIAIHQRVEDAFDSAGSVGRPALHCEVRIRDGAGNVAGPEEKGEIEVRGPSVMSGYWNDPEATAAALVDGWFRTGDIGHTDAAGYYYVDDRTKDVIISGSENIYPAELELVLDDCADIAEAAVVGRADARWGEVPVACVVPAKGARLDAADVLRLFDGRLARFKHPRDVVFLDALPRNVMGKVLKYELRERVAAASGSSAAPKNR